MTLEPLLHAPLAVRIHIATGAGILHRQLSDIHQPERGAASPGARLYLSHLDDHYRDCGAVRSCHHAEQPFFGLSPIHLFVPLTLFGVVGALHGARCHNIRQHKRAMLGVYIGGLLIAGSLAFMTGRIMHTLVFGG